MPFLYQTFYNFRNLKNDTIDLSNREVYFVGENGQGKSNILESPYYSSYGVSFRTHVDSQIIKNGQKDFSLNARTNINVLSITIPNLVLSTGEELEDSIEIKEALECLVNTGVKICKQINSSTHLAVWRDYLTTVWLHE